MQHVGFVLPDELQAAQRAQELVKNVAVLASGAGSVATRPLATLDAEVPFASVYRPWLASFDADLVLDPRRWAPAIREQLVNSLASQLATVAGEALLEQFGAKGATAGTGDDRYRAFVSHHQTDSGRDELAASYPMLLPLLDDVAQQWTVACNELDDHLVADHAALARTIGVGGRWGPVIEINAPMGDRHLGGRAVMGLRPLVGEPVAYKPRPMRAEQLIYDEIGSLLAATRDDTTQLAFPTVIDRGDRGWVSWVRAAAVTDPSAFWFHAGLATASLYWNGVTDLHGENMIVVGDAIVPLDLECFGAVDQPLHHDPQDIVADSVLSTGLFPGWYGGNGPVAVETSGLFGARDRTAGNWIRQWEELGTDAICITHALGKVSRLDNVPRFNDGTVVPTDLHQLRRGFDEGLDELAGRSETSGITATEGTSTEGTATEGTATEGMAAEPRVLVRGTKIYAAAIGSLMHPSSLADPGLFAERARIDDPLLPWKAAWLEPHIETIVAAEAAELRRLNVPLFRSAGRDLVLPDGSRLAGVFPLSAEQRLERRRVRVGAEARVAQRNLITIAVEQATGGQLESARRDYVEPGANPIDLVLSIANRLHAEALDVDGTWGWLEADKHPLAGLVSPKSGMHDAYIGAGGIACAFAAIAAIDDDKRWAETARRALWAPLPDKPEERTSGWPTGVAGQIYARLYCGRLLDDAGLIADAFDRFDAVSTHVLDPSTWETPQLDLMTHTGSWALLGSLLATETEDRDVADVARAILDRYVGAVERAWADPVDGRLLRYIGFAHRGTGVAYALARAGSTLGNDDAVALAAKMAEAEAARIAGRDGIGAAFQGSGSERKHRRGWCWGAGGWLLSRTDPVLAAHSDPEHIRRTVDFLAHDGDATHSFLCCGDAGDLVAMAAMSHGPTIDEPSLLATAQQGVDRITRRLLDLATGADEPLHFYEGVSFRAPSLYMGLAGIAWAFTHTARPDLVPNLLIMH